MLKYLQTAVVQIAPVQVCKVLAQVISQLLQQAAFGRTGETTNTNQPNGIISASFSLTRICKGPRSNTSPDALTNPASNSSKSSSSSSGSGA